MIASDRFYVLDEPVYVYRTVRSAKKTSAKYTEDFLNGLCDNIKVSRENGLAKLHFLCALRINNDAHYMASMNLNRDNNDAILGKLLYASSLIDASWLRENGYDAADPFIPETVRYCAVTTARYQKMRRSRIFRAVAKLSEK